MNGQQVHSWLLRLFNPAPDWIAREELYRMASRVDPRERGDDVMPVMTDFAESLWFNPPYSDPENGVWWLDAMPHCAVVVEKAAYAAGAGDHHRRDAPWGKKR